MDDPTARGRRIPEAEAHLGRRTARGGPAQPDCRRGAGRTALGCSLHLARTGRRPGTFCIGVPRAPRAVRGCRCDAAAAAASAAPGARPAAAWLHAVDAHADIAVQRGGRVVHGVEHLWHGCRHRAREPEPLPHRHGELQLLELRRPHSKPRRRAVHRVQPDENTTSPNAFAFGHLGKAGPLLGCAGCLAARRGPAASGEAWRLRPLGEPLPGAWDAVPPPGRRR
mmetsp:Transcript_50442/g.163244  ORF Transcript_50442/g.163244 Transcript_50442/m.163244 type:complete len:225 (+) Transcript_50442:1430-2104(+)